MADPWAPGDPLPPREMTVDEREDFALLDYAAVCEAAGEQGAADQWRDLVAADVDGWPDP